MAPPASPPPRARHAVPLHPSLAPEPESTPPRRDAWQFFASGPQYDPLRRGARQCARSAETPQSSSLHATPPCRGTACHSLDREKYNPLRRGARQCARSAETPQSSSLHATPPCRGTACHSHDREKYNPFRRGVRQCARGTETPGLGSTLGFAWDQPTAHPTRGGCRGRCLEASTSRAHGRAPLRRQSKLSKPSAVGPGGRR